MAGALVALSAVTACGSWAPTGADASTVRQDPGRWKLVSTTTVPIQYFQGMTQGGGHFYFDGIDNGLYVTDDHLAQLAAVTPAIPASVTAADKYNHVGAIGYSARDGGEVLLPMECYDTSTSVNCADTGAVGVAAPVSLDWRFEVRLDPSLKVMWLAVTPSDKLLWTSNGDDLQAFSMADISAAHAWPAHGAVHPVTTLHDALPPSGVTGGTFYDGRLFLAGSVGDDFEVWSVDTATGSRRLEISMRLSGESEGLDAYVLGSGTPTAVTACRTTPCLRVGAHGAVGSSTVADNDFSGVLHWMVMPITSGNATPSYAQPTILSFDPRRR